MIGDERGLPFTGLWVMALVVAWPIVGGLVSDVASSVTQRIPGVGLPEWPVITGYLVEAIAAYLLVWVLRRLVRAPRRAWIGIAAAKALPVVTFAIALIAVGRVPRTPWLHEFLFSGGGSVPLPAARQLAEFFRWWVWGAILPILGGWLASRSPRDAGGPWSRAVTSTRRGSQVVPGGASVRVLDSASQQAR